MKEKRLRIYLEDHLAMMVGELELIRRCRSSNGGTPLAEFLDRLEVEVEEQRTLAKNVLERVGGAENVIKQGAAWMVEKLGRLKLNDALLNYSGLSRLAELETLAVGAQERIALWDTLDAIAPRDQRLSDLGFALCGDQSQAHLTEIQSRRKHAAVEAF